MLTLCSALRTLFRRTVPPLLLAAGFCGGCAGPSARYAELAQTFGFTTERFEGTDRPHIEFWSRRPASGQPLHIYFEGDGSPWVGRHRIATDPTPREPLVLRLMRQDPAASVLVGRPCYHGLAKLPPCNPRSWTEQRYDSATVETMTAAVARIQAESPDSPLILIGYSGGGTLARLIAARVTPQSLVTIAANLDTDAWNVFHERAIFSASLNPATLPPLPASVHQLHLAGERDDNVTPALIQAAISREVAARFRIMPRFDHHCCWADIWPAPLEGLP